MILVLAPQEGVIAGLYTTRSTIMRPEKLQMESLRWLTFWMARPWRRKSWQPASRSAAELISETGVTPGIAVVNRGRGSGEPGLCLLQGRARPRNAASIPSSTNCIPIPSQDTLLKLIDDLNRDDSIHGILVQLPLPDHIDSGKVIQTIAPDKDVDGFHFTNVGKLGTGEMATAFVPCPHPQARCC